LAGINFHATGFTHALTVKGTAFDDTIEAAGTAGNKVTGGDGNDTLLGGAGADDLNGGNGNDTITGGAGADFLTGGEGADKFLYTAAGQSVVNGPSFGSADLIQDFESGDVIDLSAIGALSGNVTNLGSFLDLSALLTKVSEEFLAHSGTTVFAIFQSDTTLIFADTNGNGAMNAGVDTLIAVTGVHDTELAGGALVV